MESISLPDSFPEPLQRIHLAHFSNLDPTTQSSAIIKRIISASQLPVSTSEIATASDIASSDAERAKLDFAFLDPTRLCSKQHILSAVIQAAVVCARSWDEDTRVFREGEASLGGMKSKTPHSEIIYMLNPGNNVGESLKRFGISSKSTSLLLVKFSSPTVDPQEILERMLDVVAPDNLTLPLSQSDAGMDIDTAIRFGTYSNTTESPQPVTDWRELNKIYKLEIQSTSLLHQTQKLSEYQDIICTSVAMKLVAA
ncbi:probable Protein CGI121 [Melanopsichium pennsylvanicum]|uniref:EKC/KEOPS complex subunit CGI121 n=2 Tax=Melanopsichium pennsylvanicum TaxID=63383 RepID=A0AAJ4XT59_9BASI